MRGLSTKARRVSSAPSHWLHETKKRHAGGARTVSGCRNPSAHTEMGRSNERDRAVGGQSPKVQKATDDGVRTGQTMGGNTKHQRIRMGYYPVSSRCQHFSGFIGIFFPIRSGPGSGEPPPLRKMQERRWQGPTSRQDVGATTDLSHSAGPEAKASSASRDGRLREACMAWTTWTTRRLRGQGRVPAMSMRCWL
jgi:hypothetical protein